MGELTPIDQTDVIVVGGGIVGCATAYNIALKGLSVRVIERGPIGGAKRTPELRCFSVKYSIHTMLDPRH